MLYKGKVYTSLIIMDFLPVGRDIDGPCTALSIAIVVDVSSAIPNNYITIVTA